MDNQLRNFSQGAWDGISETSSVTADGECTLALHVRYTLKNESDLLRFRAWMRGKGPRFQGIKSEIEDYARAEDGSHRLDPLAQIDGNLSPAWKISALIDRSFDPVPIFRYYIDIEFRKVLQGISSSELDAYLNARTTGGSRSPQSEKVRAYLAKTISDGAARRILQLGDET
jgi:hypothetical protein